MIGNLCKGFFAIFIALGALIILISMWATANIGGSIDSLPIWTLLVGGVAFIWRKSRKKHDLPDSHQVQNAPASENIFHGHGANIELRDCDISITRHGLGSFLTQGLKGEKRIPFSSITAVQFKDAGHNIAGYIQFSMLGGNESNQGIFEATIDENTVMFTKEQSARFHVLRDNIERRLAEACSPQIAVVRQSVADELAKLADLWNRGILTNQEFAQQKARILAN